jgi:hypothetical protein
MLSLGSWRSVSKCGPDAPGQCELYKDSTPYKLQQPGAASDAERLEALGAGIYDQYARGYDEGYTQFLLCRTRSASHLKVTLLHTLLQAANELALP